MLDFKGSNNVMPYGIMKRWEFPHYNIYAMDSHKVEVCEIIEEIELSFAPFPKTSMVMDVMVVNVPEAWGILLSSEWASVVGGSTKVDISDVVITLPNLQQVRL